MELNYTLLIREALRLRVNCHIPGVKALGKLKLGFELSEHRHIATDTMLDFFRSNFDEIFLFFFKLFTSLSTFESSDRRVSFSPSLDQSTFIDWHRINVPTVESLFFFQL